MKAIAVAGRAGAGKTTFCMAVRDILGPDRVFVTEWASGVKWAAMQIFNLTRAEVAGVGVDREAPRFPGGQSIRDALRSVGMLGREYDPDLWVRNTIDGYPGGHDLVLVDGTRFRNELEACDGSVWIERRAGLRAQDGHITETAIGPGDCDEIVVSAGGVQALKDEARAWVRRQLE